MLILRHATLREPGAVKFLRKGKGSFKTRPNRKEVKWMHGPAVSVLYHTHLSAILADLILSMTMTCLLQHIEVDSATPRAAPGVLATSTSSGPEAVATESVKIRQQKISIIPMWYLCHFHVFPT